MYFPQSHPSAPKGFILAGLLFKASLAWGLGAAVLVPMVALQRVSFRSDPPVSPIAKDDAKRIAHVQALRAAIDAYTAEKLALPGAAQLATMAPNVVAPTAGDWYCYGIVADSGELFVAGWLPGAGRPEISGNFATDGSSTVAKAFLARSMELNYRAPGHCPAVPGYTVSEVGKG